MAADLSATNSLRTSAAGPGTGTVLRDILLKESSGSSEGGRISGVAATSSGGQSRVVPVQRRPGAGACPEGGQTDGMRVCHAFPGRQRRRHHLELARAL